MAAVLGRARQVLFGGDHLWWSPQQQMLVASCRYGWRNWEEQLRSVEQLLEFDVAWQQPGNGSRQAYEPSAWRPALERTLAEPARLLACLLYTSPSPRDKRQSRMPSSA